MNVKEEEVSRVTKKKEKNISDGIRNQLSKSVKILKKNISIQPSKRRKKKRKKKRKRRRISFGELGKYISLKTYIQYNTIQTGKVLKIKSIHSHGQLYFTN